MFQQHFMKTEKKIYIYIYIYIYISRMSKLCYDWQIQTWNVRKRCTRAQVQPFKVCFLSPRCGVTLGCHLDVFFLSLLWHLGDTLAWLWQTWGSFRETLGDLGASPLSILAESAIPCRYGLEDCGRDHTSDYMFQCSDVFHKGFGLCLKLL